MSENVDRNSGTDKSNIGIVESPRSSIRVPQDKNISQFLSRSMFNVAEAVSSWSGSEMVDGILQDQGSSLSLQPPAHVIDQLQQQQQQQQLLQGQLDVGPVHDMSSASVVNDVESLSSAERAELQQLRSMFSNLQFQPQNQTQIQQTQTQIPNTQTTHSHANITTQPQLTVTEQLMRQTQNESMRYLQMMQRERELRQAWLQSIAHQQQQQQQQTQPPNQQPQVDLLGDLPSMFISNPTPVQQIMPPVAANQALVTPQPNALQRPVSVVDRTNIGEGAGGAGTPSLVPREIKLAKPNTFSGKRTEIHNFIFEMRQYVDSLGLGTGQTACRFVVSYFKGDALTWWRTYSKDSTNVFHALTLDVLFDELLEQFTEADNEMKLRDRLLSLRQTKSLSSYINDFRKLQLELGQNRLPDDLALHVFMIGLKNYTRSQVLLQRPDTFEEAVLLSERAEQSLYWNTNAGARRNFYRSDDMSKVSQYSNSRYKGPAPMVLGTTQTEKRPAVKCFHCGKMGHYKRDCWQLNGRPNNKGRPGKRKAPSTPTLNTIEEQPPPPEEKATTSTKTQKASKN